MEKWIVAFQNEKSFIRRSGRNLPLVISFTGDRSNKRVFDFVLMKEDVMFFDTLPCDVKNERKISSKRRKRKKIVCKLIFYRQ